MAEILEFPTDACSIPQHHLYHQITAAERQLNHEREIYERSCEREDSNGGKMTIQEQNAETLARVYVRIQNDVMEPRQRETIKKALSMGCPFERWASFVKESWNTTPSLKPFTDQLEVLGVSQDALLRRVFELIKQSVMD